MLYIDQKKEVFITLGSKIMLADKISEKIKTLRKRNGWTQEELSKEMGVKQPQLNRWETGKFLPSLPSLQKLSELFDVSIDALVFDEKDIKRLKLKDKSLISKLQNIEKLSEEDKDVIFSMINSLAQKQSVHV